MKRELVIQLVLLTAAVGLLLMALVRQQKIEPIEVPDVQLLDLEDQFAGRRAGELEELEFDGPTPTPFPPYEVETPY